RLYPRLLEQEIVKVLVGCFGGEREVGARAKRLGNPILVGGRQKDRDELHGPAAGFVQLTRDERAFPIHAPALARLFMPAESAVVGLRANYEHGVSGVELIEHPTRPALSRCPVHVLVEERLGAISAQTL